MGQSNMVGQFGNVAELPADLQGPQTALAFVNGAWETYEAGEPLASIYARDRAGIDRGRSTLRAAITIADDAEPPLPLVSHRVTKEGVEELR